MVCAAKLGLTQADSKEMLSTCRAETGLHQCGSACRNKC